MSKPDLLTRVNVYYANVLRNREFVAPIHEELHVNVWQDYDAALSVLEEAAKKVVECSKTEAQKKKQDFETEEMNVLKRAILRNRAIDSGQPERRD